MSDELACTVRLKLGRTGGDPATVFGRGTAALLRGVASYGSLNRAAAAMGMAYSKAWTGIRDTEAQLGFSLMERRAQRGCVLTPEGRRLLEAYERAERAAEAAARAALRDSGF